MALPHEDPGTFTVVMLGSLYRPFRAWLDQHGLEMGTAPDLEGTFIVVPQEVPDLPEHLPASLYDVARDATDSVLGAGTYARANAGHPDPGVRAAIERGASVAGGAGSDLAIRDLHGA
jgi:hypothetical protein